MRALALALAATLAGPACSSPRPATEMVIEVDADPGVRARTASVRVEVFGRAEADDPFPAEPIHGLPYVVPIDGARWGPIVVLVPEARDARRSYRAVAIALDASGDEITRTSLISGYVESVSLRFRLYLQSSCEGVSCDDDETCRDGICTGAFVDPRALLDAGTAMDAAPEPDAGRDAGGGLDGGPRDVGTADAPPVCGDCSDGMDCTVDRCVGGTCVHDVACDDLVDCTVDACGAGGVCTHTADVSLCTGGGECASASCDETSGCSYVPDASLCDDGDDCTDDTCALVTGCTNAPLTGVACDDGVYCNGLDTCSAGACGTHTGTPCPGGMAACDEAADRCTGCTTMGCPPTMTSGYGACASTGPCTGERFATTTTYACNGATGACDPSTSTEVDTTGCEAMLAGDECASPTCSTGSCGGFTDTCDESGSAMRTCTPHVCAAGSCSDDTAMVDSVSCSRTTTGVLCNNSCDPGFSCSYVDPACSESGLSQRTCRPSYCGTGACRSGMPYTEPNPSGDGSCDRETDGLSCGPVCLSCVAGVCSSACGFDAGLDLDAGTDAPFFIPDAGTDAGTDAPLFIPDAGGCGTAPCCTSPGLCSGRSCCPWQAGADPNGCVTGGCLPRPGPGKT